MRDLLNLIESLSVLTEKSRGLLYRAKGDRFFKGKRDNPEQALLFDKVEYFPSQPGAYESYEDMIEAYDEISANRYNVVEVNNPTKASKAFVIITLIDEKTKRPVYFSRFFSQIKPDMAGTWKNSEIPGGFQLEKETSLKASYGLKPSDIFPEPARFNNINTLLVAFKQSEAAQPFLPGFEMLYLNPPKLPIFEGATEYYTAIRDDLGEIIGPVALIQGMNMGTGAEAAKRDLLDGGDWSGSSISFPSGKTNGLVDSYIVTTNGVEVGISSKGEKGATASVKNIGDGVDFIKNKGTDEQKKLLKKYAAQIKILDDISTGSTIGFPLKYGVSHNMISQPTADIIPQLIKTGAKSLTGLQLNENVLDELRSLIEAKGAKTQLPNYNVGYHALASLAEAVARDINNDAIFGEACLKFLNSSPVIQLHMSAAKQKDGDVAVTGFISKYPPNFKGTVRLDASKNYSSTMAGGRMNFAYNGVDAGIEEPGDANIDREPNLDIARPVADLSTSSMNIINPKRKEPEEKPRQVGDVGRQKRKS